MRASQKEPWKYKVECFDATKGAWEAADWTAARAIGVRPLTLRKWFPTQVAAKAAIKASYAADDNACRSGLIEPSSYARPRYRVVKVTEEERNAEYARIERARILCAFHVMVTTLIRTHSYTAEELIQEINVRDDILKRAPYA
jgi:hypothetical protein